MDATNCDIIGSYDRQKSLRNLSCYLWIARGKLLTLKFIGTENWEYNWGWHFRSTTSESTIFLFVHVENDRNGHVRVRMTQTDSKQVWDKSILYI